MNDNDSGITLEGLAERLAALERENADLRNKVAGLEGLGTPGRDAGPPSERRAPAFEGRISRRRLLGKAAAAAVGTVAAGTLLARDAGVARADHGFTNTIDAGRINVDIVRAVNSNADVTLLATARHTGIYGLSNRLDNQGTGVFGTSDGSGRGVWGNCRKGTGVYGQGRTGVRGESPASEGIGVAGETTGDFAPGVSGRTTGFNGQGVSGEAQNGTGVLGTGRTGVAGKSTGTGYAGYFEGGKAQLRIMPDLEAGRPTTGSHFKGEIYMDTAGALFVCTGTGIPGKWRRFATVAT